MNQKQEAATPQLSIRQLLMTPLGILAIIGTSVATYILVVNVILEMNVKKKIFYDEQKGVYYEIVT